MRNKPVVPSTKDKVSRIQVKFKEPDDLERKAEIDALARSLGTNTSKLLQAELLAMYQENDF